MMAKKDDARDPATGFATDETCLWDAQDVARYLKVSRSWVYHRAEAGELPCFRVGGLLRFDPGAIRAFVRGQGTKGARVVPLRVEPPQNAKK